MYIAHIKGGAQVDELLDTVKKRFETIYRSISVIERSLDEDDVLLYTLRVFFNSLYEDSPIERIEKALEADDSLRFIREFTQALSESFVWLQDFFSVCSQRVFAVHSLISLGNIGLVLPFILKAYKLKLGDDELSTLSAKFEKLILRHRLIGTNARLVSRLNDAFSSFNNSREDFTELLGHFEFLDSAQEYFWGHWSTEKLKESIEGEIDHKLAIFILWKYENHLRAQGSTGYQPLRFDSIVKPELEHISPRTESEEEAIAAGYDEYTEAFLVRYLDCLGNYLLVSKSHNCAIGNKPFREKRASYTNLEQQREIQNMTERRIHWGARQIEQRQQSLRDFIIGNL